MIQRMLHPVAWRTGMYRLVGALSRRVLKEVRNPLPGLTPKEARALYELYRRGQYADVMLTWMALEETDDMLGTVFDRRASALEEMSHDVKIDAKTVGDDEGMKRLAEEQQQCLAEYYGNITNLREAITFLGTATFRGYAMLEPFATLAGVELCPIEPWLICRPDGVNWLYNANGDRTCLKGEVMDTSGLVVRECPRPVDLPAMFAICAKAHAQNGWDGFIDVFGNPAIFFKYPPGTSDEAARAYDRIAEEMIGDGRGGYPDGGDIKTVETTARGGDTFRERCEWCDKQIVRRGTGGELTVIAESGSGTLAGGAHAETFRQLAAGEGAKISECFRRSLSASLLNRYFPGQRHLAYWTVEYVEPDDVGGKVTNIVQLASAGYVADEEQVSETVGFSVTYQMPSLSEQGQMLPNRSRTITGPGIGMEATPLSRDELALLEDLTHARPRRDIVERRAEELETAINEGIGSMMDDESEMSYTPVATPLQNANSGHCEDDEGEEDAPDDDLGDEDELLTNFGTPAGAKKGWITRGTGAGSPAHGKGRSREHFDRKNAVDHPNEAPIGASVGRRQRVLKKAIKGAKKDNKTRRNVVYQPMRTKSGQITHVPLDITAKSVRHADKHEDVSSLLAETIAKGKYTRIDRGDDVYEYGRRKIVTETVKKNSPHPRKTIRTHYIDRRRF